MMIRCVRSVALLVLVGATLAACGEDAPESSEPSRSDLASTTTVAPPAVSDTSTSTEFAETSAATSTPEPTPTPEPEQSATADDAAATEEMPPAQIDWRNTTYRMRAYSGSDLAELAFIDGVAETVVIAALQIDPADPHRVAMISTSSDSEGYPLFVNAGIFTLDQSSGVAMPEAEVSTMSGNAVLVHLCATGVMWDGVDELSLEFGDCEVGEPGSLQWSRDGSTLLLHESEGGVEDAGDEPETGTGTTLDVSSYGEVHFTSHSGAIVCTMTATIGGWAACHFPEGMNRTGLPGGDHCGHTTLAGVGVGREVGWVCSGGAFVMPEVSIPPTAWFEDSGWTPAVSGAEGFQSTSAAVPYGATLVLDNLACHSAEDGMHCDHTVSGAGFSLARAGVQRHGPLTDTFTELWD